MWPFRDEPVIIAFRLIYMGAILAVGTFILVSYLSS